MNLEERIVSLLKTGDRDSTILAAMLLQSINCLEEEIRIFESACSKSLDPSDWEGKGFLSLKYIIMPEPRFTGHSRWLDIKGKRWIIFFTDLNSTYLMKEHWRDSTPKIEI